jgi:hypothetical protein
LAEGSCASQLAHSGEMTFRAQSSTRCPICSDLCRREPGPTRIETTPRRMLSGADAARGEVTLTCPRWC